jgi:stage II sporulation protein AA (anti-sigma F factor antagonist)
MAEEFEMDDKKAQHLPRLTVVTAMTDGIRVLTVTGEIDQNTIEPLHQALDVSGLPRPRIVIDLHQVTFMDSAGINALIGAYKTVTAAGGWLRLAAPTDSVMRLLQLVRVHTIIDCHPTLRDALVI